MGKIRYLWINQSGEMSKSWDEEAHEMYMTDEVIKISKIYGFKLIKYECLNDTDFKFKPTMDESYYD